MLHMEHPPPFSREAMREKDFRYHSFFYFHTGGICYGKGKTDTETGSGYAFRRQSDQVTGISLKEAEKRGGRAAEQGQGDDGQEAAGGNGGGHLYRTVHHCCQQPVRQPCISGDTPVPL